VCGPTQGDNRKDGNGNGKERGKLKSKGNQCKEHTCEDLREDNEELFGLINLQKRAP